VLYHAFANGSAFHNATALHLQQDQKEDSMPQFTSDFLKRYLASAIGRHHCILTHGDLQLKNVLVVDDYSVTLSRWFVVSGIVDWEGAGWMPIYWEYASMFILAD
jgi:thiamine kinase-like enzyme